VDRFNLIIIGETVKNRALITFLKLDTVSKIYPL